MVDRELVARKISTARVRLEDSEMLASRYRTAGNTHDRDLSAFYLLLAVHDAIDLAAHWVADAGWRTPNDASDAFEVLAEHNAIDKELAAAMRGAVAVRNRIAYGYETVDHGQLYSQMPTGNRDIRSFLLAAHEAAAAR